MFICSSAKHQHQHQYLDPAPCSRLCKLEEHFFLHAVFCDYDVPQGLRASEVYLRASLLAHGLGGPEVAVRPWWSWTSGPQQFCCKFELFKPWIKDQYQLLCIKWNWCFKWVNLEKNDIRDVGSIADLVWKWNPFELHRRILWEHAQSNPIIWRIPQISQQQERKWKPCQNAA